MSITANSPHENMVWIEGGSFLMGSDIHYPEERPSRKKEVAGFWMDITPVTNQQFSRFVKETGYLTVAEQTPDSADFPEVDPILLVPGSLVFRPAEPGSSPRHFSEWWFYVPGACWHRPDGINALTPEDSNKPVVQVCWLDAMAYSRWANKSLPTEAEWEFAARGGLNGYPYAWGETFQPDGNIMANTWQGIFPFRGSAGKDCYYGTSPVGAFPPNPFGLFDMIGNVWEWTEDEWQTGTQQQSRSCCHSNSSPDQQKVLKGGSHLCAPNYCQRYRPAARHGQTTDSATTHISFRCIKRA